MLPLDGHSTFATTTIAQPASFDLQAMQQKAKIFAKQYQEDYHRPEDTAQTLENYINTILCDPVFQNNPRQYLDAWKRNSDESFNFPEDPARRF